MKKYIAMVLCLGMILLATACDPGSFYFDAEDLKENVVEISLIDYENPEAKELFENREGVLPFDFDKMTVIKTLPAERHEEFLEEFCKTEFLMTWRHLDSPKGKSLMLTYSDGKFEIISLNEKFVCGYNEDGSLDFFIGEIAYSTGLQELVNRYFE